MNVTGLVIFALALAVVVFLVRQRAGKEARRGNWFALVGGALTGIVIGTVQRAYPDISFVSLMCVGIISGALFNLTTLALTNGKKRNQGA